MTSISFVYGPRKRLAGIAAALALAGLALAQGPAGVSVKDLLRQSQEAAAKGQWSAALQLARDAVALDAAYADAWRQLGAMLARSGKTAEAIEALRNATQLNPNDAAAWRDLGWALWMAPVSAATQDPREEALAAWERAVNAGLPQKKDLAIQILAALAESGKTEEGLGIFRRWAPDVPILEPAVRLVERGRTVAASPLLEKAWNAGENPPISGLYLAYANAVNGRCANAAKFFKPFIENLNPQTSTELVDMALETLLVCSGVENLSYLLDRLEVVVAARKKATDRITDVLEKAAEEKRFRGELRRAWELYRRVLGRDPSRPSWLIAAKLLTDLDGPDAADAWLADLAQRTPSVAVRAGIEAEQALRAGNLAESAQSFAQSLSAGPNQPLLRQDYAQVLLRMGATDEARRQAEWFAQRIEQGDSTLRSYLAELWTRLRKYEKALEIWQFLSLSQPGIPYYSVETASLMFRLCEAQNALGVLQATVAVHPYPQAYELIAEIFSALGQPERAAEEAAVGIAMSASPTPGVLQQHAENAEAAGLISTSSLASSAAFLARNPGHANMSLRHGYQLWILGLTNEAVSFHEQLVSRNSSLLAARAFLKDAYSARRQFKKAVEHARAGYEVSPTSVDWARGYGLALAEYERWHRAFTTLRRAADQEPGQTVPVLVYRAPNTCDYPARLSVNKLSEHFSWLAEDEYRFILP